MNRVRLQKFSQQMEQFVWCIWYIPWMYWSHWQMAVLYWKANMYWQSRLFQWTLSLLWAQYPSNVRCQSQFSLLWSHWSLQNKWCTCIQIMYGALKVATPHSAWKILYYWWQHIHNAVPAQVVHNPNFLLPRTNTRRIFFFWINRATSICT